MKLNNDTVEILKDLGMILLALVLQVLYIGALIVSVYLLVDYLERM